MRFVLLMLLLFLWGVFTVSAQGPSALAQLPSARQKEIRQKVRALPFTAKILSFTLVSEEGSTPGSRAAGVVAARIFPREGGPNTLIRVFNLRASGPYHGLPFPGAATRQAAARPMPPWLPGLFGADLVLDVAGEDVLFYGLDSTGVYLQSTAYRQWDSLLTAVLRHDLLWVARPEQELAYRLNNLRPTRLQKKALAEKLSRHLAATARPAKPVTLPSTLRVQQWLWQTYSNSITAALPAGRLPLQDPAAVSLCSFTFDSTAFTQFNRIIRYYAPVPVYYPQNNPAQDLHRLSAYDLVLVPATGLSPAQQQFIEALRANTAVALIGFAAEPEQSAFSEITVIPVAENNRLTQTLAAGAIFGAENPGPCRSRLRYGPPALAGMRPERLQKIDSVVAAAIRQGAMPGCQVLVAKDGMVVWHKAYGYQTYDSLLPVTPNTRYDLASLTKVLATTQGIMYLTETMGLNLDDTLAHYLPYLRNTNKKAVTVRQVLAHQAGLYPYYPFWKKARKELLAVKPLPARRVQAGRSLWVSPAIGDSILRWAATSDLLAERVDTITHAQYVYSDIGFYFLKDLIELQTRQPLDEFLTRFLYAPLGTGLRYQPTCYYPDTGIAPTEEDTELRHELLRGYVHDRNAALMGGVGGQAGLFGNANDVAILLQLQLNGGCYGGHRYFQPQTLRAFTSRHYARNRRGLGWDMPGTEEESPVSKLASTATYGHSGFTGGSIWVDPKENLIFVFLSNRVYPSAGNTKLIDMNIRTLIQDIVYRSLEK